MSEERFSDLAVVAMQFEVEVDEILYARKPL